jgi:hypothetical protein
VALTRAPIERREDSEPNRADIWSDLRILMGLRFNARYVLRINRGKTDLIMDGSLYNTTLCSTVKSHMPIQVSAPMVRLVRDFGSLRRNYSRANTLCL